MRGLAGERIGGRVEPGMVEQGRWAFGDQRKIEEQRIGPAAIARGAPGQAPGGRRSLEQAATRLAADVEKRARNAEPETIAKEAVGDRRRRLRIAEDAVAAISGHEGACPDLGGDLEMGFLITDRLGPVRRPWKMGPERFTDVEVVEPILTLDEREPQPIAQRTSERPLIAAGIVGEHRQAIGIGAATGEARGDDRQIETP